MARSKHVEVTFYNGMRTRALTWRGDNPSDSTIRSIFFRSIADIAAD